MPILARNTLAGTWCLAVLVTGLLCGGASAGDAQATFDDLFGRSVQAAKATRDTADDVDLALELLAAARQAGEHPQLLAIICTQAYDLVIRLEGEHDLAVAAMTLLADGSDEHAIGALEKIVELREERYDSARGLARRQAGEDLIDSFVALAEALSAAGETPRAAAAMSRAEQLAAEVAPNRQGRLYEATQRMEVHRRASQQAAECLSRLSANPDDSQARAALVRLELTDMDDPVAAAGHVDASVDEFLRTYVPLAAKGPEQLSPVAALEVGAWYVHLADEADAVVAAAMFRRAAGYLHRAAADEQDVAEKLRAQLLARSARNGLASVSGMPLATGEYHELVVLVDLREDILAGGWRQLNGGLQTLGKDEARIRLPVKLVGSYTLQVKLTRTDGAGMAAITLPVGDTAVLLKLDAMGLSGLELVDGESTVENATALIGRKLENNRSYSLTAEVSISGERASIAVRVSGRTWVSWRGKMASLGPPWEWSAQQDGAVVIGSDQAAWQFDSVRVKTSDPTCRRLR